MTRLRKTSSTGVGKAGAPETGRVLPPRSGARLLPFNELHDESFEHLCDDLVGFEPAIVSTDLKRTGGVAQYGVDVEGFDDRHRPVLVLSASVEIGRLRVAGGIGLMLREIVFAAGHEGEGDATSS